MSIIQMTPAEFRAKYLKNLTTEVKNQQKYLDATRTFNQTGEPSEIPDLRTVDEKATDLEGLKNLIIKELETLTDRGNASSFVNSITNVNSPDLSIKQLKNFYQFFPNFEAEVKKRFRYGVSSTILLDFYRKYTANFNEENYGIETPLTAESIAEAIDKKMRRETQKKESDKDFQDFKKESDDGEGLPDMLPPQDIDEYNRRREKSESEEPIIEVKAIEPFGKIRDISQVRETPTKYSASIKGEMDLLLSDYVNLIQKLQDQNTNLNLNEDQKNERVKFIEEKIKFIDGKKSKKGGTKKVDPKGTDVKNLFKDKDGDWAKLVSLAKGEDLQNISGRGIKKNMKIKNTLPDKKVIKGKGIIKSNKGNKLAEFGRYYIDPNLLEENIISMKNNAEMRRPLPQIPTKKVSQRVSNVVKKIVGGAISLSYEDVIDLDDNEKIYLNDLVKKVRLNDVVKIPVPDKDKLQKEMDRFELLKGQILSGNDSKELIKEFKILLLKFQKQGKLPKREVNEILYELMILS